MIAANIDCLVLGCSHYPYLIPLIKKIIPKTVQIIDSGQAVAKQTRAILEKHNMINTFEVLSNQIFYTNTNTTVLENILGFTENVLEKDF